MEVKEFREQLAKISHDLLYGHLSQNEALFKLKELLASPLLLDRISAEEIDKELDRVFQNTYEPSKRRVFKNGMELMQKMMLSKQSDRLGSATSSEREEIRLDTLPPNTDEMVNEYNKTVKVKKSK